MGSVAVSQIKIPGIGGQINANQITQVKKRLKKNKALICSMTMKQIAYSDLFVKDKSSQTRLRKLLLALERFMKFNSLVTFKK